MRSVPQRSNRQRMAQGGGEPHAAAESAPHPTVGLFAQLPPEQQALALAYRGEETQGDPEFRRAPV